MQKQAFDGRRQKPVLSLGYSFCAIAQGTPIGVGTQPSGCFYVGPPRSAAPHLAKGSAFGFRKGMIPLTSTSYSSYSFASFLKRGNAFSMRSVCTQYAIRTQPSAPKSAPFTSNNSYFFARSQNAAASFSGDFINK